jgi:UDP-GlcNAc:undecaprenyl-phosphate GlcNAc-1-phosphate transferase
LSTPFWALGILLAALLAFLVFNMRYPKHPKASVFLGDSGSLCMGMLVGWFCIKLTQGEAAPFEPATVIWIIALPVMDAFALFIARSLRGLHPFNADRRHLHHRFLDAGISPGKTTAIMLGLISLFALIGFSAQAAGVPPVVLFWLWMAVFVLHTIGIMHPRGYTLFSRFLRVRVRENRG